MKYHFTAYINKKTRIDMYLSEVFFSFSRSYIQKTIDKWFVKVNGEVLNKNKKIENKDEIILEIILSETYSKPENIPLDIVFENKNFAIINKDYWINTHETPWEEWKKWTLVNALLYHIKDLAWIWWEKRPWIVHRLDKNTSWLLVIAKNDKTMQSLQEKMKNRETEKFYIAIVSWKVNNKKFKIESDIWRDPNSRIKMKINSPINPKNAITYWEVVSYLWDDFTILKLKLETWRTHQIRVHLSWIWHPIIWDDVYWIKKINDFVSQKYQIKRQMLHSLVLKFEVNNKNYSFIWEPKNDMLIFLKKFNFDFEKNDFWI